MSLDDLARDLAAAGDITVEEAADALRQALTADVPPLRITRRLPWYVRLLPLRWRQRWVWRELNQRGNRQ